MAPVSTIAVYSSVRCGSGVMCGLGEDIGAGIVSGGLQRYTVGIKVLSKSVLDLTTTALSIPLSQTSAPSRITLTRVPLQLKIIIRQVVNLVLTIRTQFLGASAPDVPIATSTPLATTATSNKLLQSTHFLTEKVHVGCQLFDRLCQFRICCGQLCVGGHQLV